MISHSTTISLSFIYEIKTCTGLVNDENKFQKHLVTESDLLYIYILFSISIIKFYEIQGGNHKIVWFASAACPYRIESFILLQ